MVVAWLVCFCLVLSWIWFGFVCSFVGGFGLSFVRLFMMLLCGLFSVLLLVCGRLLWLLVVLWCSSDWWFYCSCFSVIRFVGLDVV